MVKRITKTTPGGGAKLKRPDGSTYMELPKTPFDDTPTHPDKIKISKSIETYFFSYMGAGSL